jgi:hypothetical protein
VRIWIDCEFNEFRGELISLALVSEDGREWYGVLPCENPGGWVAQHVMPILGRAPMEPKTFAMSLHRWLMQFDAIHVIADWPEDISHFCQALIVGPGERINTPPLTMEVRRDLDEVPSLLPHNALADARAIMESHLNIECRSQRT